MELGRPAWLDLHMVKKKNKIQGVYSNPKKIGKYYPNLEKIVNYLFYHKHLLLNNWDVHPGLPLSHLGRFMPSLRYHPAEK